MYLYEKLNIQPGIIAVIGSGGKTSLLRSLAFELKDKGTVILTTTTHIVPFPEFPLATSLEELKKLLQESPVVCAATPCGGGKLKHPSFSIENCADYILVEADGAKHLPLKAHLEYEPVIPKQASQIIQVIGSHGFRKEIREVAHRKERYAELLGVQETEITTPDLIAKVINIEALCTAVFVNELKPISKNDKELFINSINYPTIFLKLKKEEHERY